MTTLLRGPKDPDAFRVQVNRTRWYRDPLPADAKWPAMTEAVPAVTTVKGAWSKPFKKKTPTGLVVPLDAYRAAEYVQNNLEQLSRMHPEQVFTEVATAPDRDLAKAAIRGTALHSVFEALAVGQRLAPELHDDAVRPFLPACEAFIDEWQPVFRITEFVVINRALGFAGTADCLAELPGICTKCGQPLGLTVIDYKSRGSAHGAYEEEVCQLGAYASGEYVVVTNEAGDLERIDPPDIAHGAIVSITADDGYRVYPVEIAEARHAFLGMFETWRIGRDGKSIARQAIGKPAAAPSGWPSDDAGNDQHNGEQQRVRQVESSGTGDGAQQNAEARYDEQPHSDTHLPASEAMRVGQPPSEPHAEVSEAVHESKHQGNELAATHAGSDASDDRAEDVTDAEQLPPVEQPSLQDAPSPLDLETPDVPVSSFELMLAHVRSRVAVIVEAAAGRPLPVQWPHGTPTFKSGGVSAEHLPAISEWCDTTEAKLGLPFPPPSPSELAADEAARAPAPAPTPAEPRPNPRADAEEWAARGRALLSLLHDEPLARACARTAQCDDTFMSRERYLALQAVVSQMSEPAGVVVAYWSGDGVELRPVNDMEKALLAQMPTEGTITKATKLDALQRGKRVAKRLGMTSPKTYDELCADLTLAACVAVGHGRNPEQRSNEQV